MDITIFRGRTALQRYLKSDASQSLLRISSSERNQNLQSLAISPDLSLIATDFIRLCGQRFHVKLSLEENPKRKFNRTYGKDWTEVTLHLDLGCFLHVNTSKEIMRVYCVPCFETKRLPQAYQLKARFYQIQPKPKRSLLHRFKEWIKWEILIGQILIVVGFIWIFIYDILDAIKTQKIIEYNAQFVGKTKKTKEYIFVNEEETEEDTAFGMPIDMLEEEN